MRKKSLFIAFFICIGLLIPNAVFAEITNEKASYFALRLRFALEDEPDVVYRLYDKSNVFNFESVHYNQYSDNAFFGFSDFSSYNFRNYDADFFNAVESLECTSLGDNYLDYVSSEYFKNCFDSLLEDFPDYKFNNFYFNDVDYGYYKALYGEWTSSTSVPMIIEEVNNPSNKKIVFGNLHNSLFFNFKDYQAIDRYSFSLNSIFTFANEYKDYYRVNHEAIEFMRDNVYDYSDELWNALNSKRIASPEIPNFVENFNNSSPEIEEEPQNKDSNNPILKNPETYNNGIMILFLSLIFVISISVFVIRKKKTN